MPSYSIHTDSGREFDYLNPTAEMVCVNDVAVGLAQTCRFSGQLPWFYSVAEHSILVADVARTISDSPDLIKAALWHDAHEAYMTDLPTPLKALVGKVWHDVAERVDQAVADYLGIDAALFKHPAIKLADQRVLVYEARILKGQDWVSRYFPHTNLATAQLDESLITQLARDRDLTLALDPDTAYHHFDYCSREVGCSR